VTDDAAAGAFIVVCDDERGELRSIERALEKAGHRVSAHEDARAALEALHEAGGADLLITDIRMPDVSGFDLLREAKTHWPDLPVVLITGFPSIPSSFEAGRAGADHYIEKPLDIHDLRRAVADLLATRRGRGPAAPADEVLPGLVGRSAPMRELALKIRQVAPTHATVLIRGESGTGKEIVARAIHDLSEVRKDVFLALNCAAIPGHLLESELFGHERGAFTGAVARQAGKFELANGGTLFLDEIGELAPDLQAKMLRVLEERHFMRVGGQAPVPFDARLLAATNRDLQVMVREGRFREDLYYRLNVVAIDIPALRDRGDDVRLLAERFVRQFATRYGKAGLDFSPETLAALARCRWTGNVRELRNLVESLVVLSRSGTIDLSDLPPAYRDAPAAGPAPSSSAAAAATEDSPKTMRDIERDAILQALREAGGNRDRAARQLGIGKRTLQRKIKEYRDEGLDI